MFVLFAVKQWQGVLYKTRNYTAILEVPAKSHASQRRTCGWLTTEQEAKESYNRGHLLILLNYILLHGKEWEKIRENCQDCGLIRA